MAERIRKLVDHPPSAADAPPTKTDINVRGVALTVIAIAATMYVLSWAQEAFIPIILSILISYALEPVVAWTTRLRLPRPAGAAVVVTLVTGLLGYGIYSLSDEGTAIVAQLPEAAQKFRRLMASDRDNPGAIEQVQKAAAELQKTADQAAGANPVPKD